MAGPQLEDGFTQIANELLERLAAARLSSLEMSVMLILTRLCYSAKKKKNVSLPIDELAYFLGISKPNASRLLASMVKKGLIIRIKAATGRSPAEFSIQKNWNFWETGRPIEWPALLARFGSLKDLELSPVITQHVTGDNSTDPFRLSPMITQHVTGDNSSDRETHTSIDVKGPPKSKRSKERSPIERTRGGSSDRSNHVPRKQIEKAKKRLFQITDIFPNDRDYLRVRSIARIPPPAGWIPDEWKDHCLETVFEQLRLVAGESNRGFAIGSVYAVACSRSRQKLQTQAMQGERHNETA